ncbi:transmembrane protein [Cystoisospora suis]|uniref:Transmembrane protein n=1 Tax=Cystoisospora suis TaxID=483139 RepID=A0A2C6L444_9APIC|nr:transmembrane protein [Cystoisospora suis]
MGGEDDCCCGVPTPTTPEESKMLLVGGIVNLVVPFGVGTLLAGCALNSSQLIKTGTFQLITTFLLFGALWCFVYGILMILAGARGPQDGGAETRGQSPATAAVAPPTQNPPPTGKPVKAQEP